MTHGAQYGADLRDRQDTGGAYAAIAALPNCKFHQLIGFHCSCEMLPVVLRDNLYRSSAVGSKQENTYPIQGS